MRELVIDASVVLKWYLPDEPFGGKAMRILGMHVAEGLSICAPGILPYEVLNALLVAERRSRTPEGLTEQAFDAFMELDIALFDPFVNWPGLLSMARQFTRSIYDAAYLSLAGGKGIDLVTGDRRLYNAVQGKLGWVKWIGGYV